MRRHKAERRTVKLSPKNLNPAQLPNKAPHPSALQRAGPDSASPVAVVGALQCRAPQARAAVFSRPLRSPPGPRRHVGLAGVTRPGLPVARGPRTEIRRRKALQAGSRARVPVSGRAQVAAAPAPRAAAPVGNGGAGPARRGGEREAAGCGRPGIPSSTSYASQAGCAVVAASRRPASRRWRRERAPPASASAGHLLPAATVRVRPEGRFDNGLH